MPYTQRFRKPGDASITLRSSTPWGVLDAIRPQDHIVITPQRIHNPADLTRATLLAFARLGGFTMVYLRRNGKYTLSGPDVSYWLGGGEGYANPIVPKEPRSNRIRLGSAATLTTWLNGLFPANGITLGTVTNTGTSTTGAIPYPAPLREALDDICQLTGAEWRVNHDFTLDAGPSTTLYPLTPTVLLTDQPGGTEGTLRSVQALNLSRDIDASMTATRVIGYGAGTETGGNPTVRAVTGTPTGVRNVRPGGGTPDFTVLADAPGIRPSGLNAHLTSVLNEYASPEVEVRLAVRAYGISTIIRPGDRLWCWSPLDDIYDLANQIDARGQVAFPMRLRDSSLTAPVTSEMGVFALINDGATIIDLSPWVEWEDGADTQIEATTTGRRPGAVNISSSTVIIGDDSSSSGGTGRMATRGSAIRNPDNETTAGWTPTLGNFNIGTGGSAGVVASYLAPNDSGMMTLEVSATVGTTGASRGATGDVTVPLPDGYELDVPTLGVFRFGEARIVAAGTAVKGVVDGVGTTVGSVRVGAENIVSSRVQRQALSASVPGVWTADDGFTFIVDVPVRYVG